MALLAFFSLVLPTPDDRRITRNQLPIPVRKTADEQSAGATIRAFTVDIDSGHHKYRVELTINGHSKDVTIAPDGRVIEIEEQVDAAVLPVAVVSALRNEAQERQITKIESITKNGAIVAYEAHVRTTRGHAEIRVGPSGESLSHED